MADRGYAKSDQIVGGELRQNLGINVIALERLLVALQSQPLQPRRDIHVLLVRP